MDDSEKKQETQVSQPYENIQILNEEPNYQRYWYNAKNDFDVQSRVKKKIILQCVICFTFMVIEAVGAYLSHSIAILTDVAHLSSDLLGFFVSLIGIIIAEKINRERKTYGYIKVEVIGAFFSLLIIWILTVWVFYKALERMHKIVNNEKIYLNSKIMVIMACSSLLMNIIMMTNLLSEDDEEKQHRAGMFIQSDIEEGDDENENLLTNQKQTELKQNANLSVSTIVNTQNLSHITSNDNQNIKAAQVHILGDLVQSLGVIIISVTIYFKPSWIFLDPIISIIFILISITFSIKPAIEIFNLLTDSVPDGLKVMDVYKKFHKIDNVKAVHDMHIWNLAEGKPVLTCHIQADNNLQKVLQEATVECRRLGIYHTTIQVEQYKSKIAINCDHNVHPQFNLINHCFFIFIQTCSSTFKLKIIYLCINQIQYKQKNNKNKTPKNSSSKSRIFLIFFICTLIFFIHVKSWSANLTSTIIFWIQKITIWKPLNTLQIFIKRIILFTLQTYIVFYANLTILITTIFLLF